jgi:hypothetical protein
VTDHAFGFERWLFPKSPILDFVVIACLAATFSYLLIGRQILQANWGPIDDHEVFTYLGTRPHLRLEEVWGTLFNKTEVGQLEGRFRPAFYLVKVVEAAVFGTNVHLWYLTNAICFALFLSSLWWTMLRFVGIWLGGALTASIALLPLWSGVWSRLGPSEIYGAACVGLMLFAANAILSSKSSFVRNAAAILFALTGVVLAGVKETFLPLTLMGVAFVFVHAWVQRQLPSWLVAILGVFVLASLAGIVSVVLKEQHGGVDFYGRSNGLRPTVYFTIIGFLDALLRTCWLWVLPIAFFQLLRVIPRQSLLHWISRSILAVEIYAFLLVMFAAQCGLYRIGFPSNSRYDFPAMLLVPLTCCVLAGDLFSKLRKCLPERTVDYAQFVAAIFLIFFTANSLLGSKPPLAVAVKENIERTNAFSAELHRLVESANAAPESPIVLEAHGPIAYEFVFSLLAYIPAMGIANPISVRLHGDASANSAFSDGLLGTLASLENGGSYGLTPLARNLAAIPSNGCLSVGLNGAPDPGCSPFQIKW